MMKTINAAALFGSLFISCASAVHAADAAAGDAAEPNKETALAAKDLAKDDSLQANADAPKQNQEPNAGKIAAGETPASDKSPDVGLKSQSWQYVPFNPLSGKPFHKASLLYKKGSATVLLSILPESGKSSEQDAAAEVAKILECRTDQSSAGHIYPERDAELSKRIAEAGASLPQGSFYKVSCAAIGPGDSVSDAQDNLQKSADETGSATNSIEQDDKSEESAGGSAEVTARQAEKKIIQAWDAQTLPADIYIKRGGREILAIAVHGGDLADAAELLVQQQKDAKVYQQTRTVAVEARNAAADKAIEENLSQAPDDSDDELHNPDDLPPDEILQESKENGTESAAELIAKAVHMVRAPDDGKSEAGEQSISQPVGGDNASDKTTSGE